MLITGRIDTATLRYVASVDMHILTRTLGIHLTLFKRGSKTIEHWIISTGYTTRTMSEWRIRKDQIFWSVSTLGCRFVVRARRRCCAYTSAFGSRLSAAPGSTARAPRQTCNVRRVTVRVAWYCNSYTCSTATGGLEDERQSQQRE